MRGKRGFVIGCAALATAAVVWAAWNRARADDPGLSLTFQKYDQVNPFVPTEEKMAFLWLTNASKKTYALTLPVNGGAPTADPVLAAVGKTESSWLVNCEFIDSTPAATNHWSQATPFRLSLSLAPHSGVRIRVPLPPSGQRRRVAVLCQEQPGPWKPPPAWVRRSNFLTLLYLRQQLLVMKFKSPHPLRVWCEREIVRE